jgi:hypothetical protein
MKTHGLPLTWNDAVAPVFGAGSGAGAPSNGIISTASPSDSTLDVYTPVFTASTNDRVFMASQILHDLHIPDSGNCTFRLHAHVTFVSEPTDARTVILKASYVYAKPGATLGAAGTFAANPTILTGTTYTTTASAEVRKHLIIPFPAVTIPVAECGPSMAFLRTLKLDSTSTIDSGTLSILFADWHYLQGPRGTDSEYA